MGSIGSGPAINITYQRIAKIFGRSERIRTSDPLVPNEVRYQAALHSDIAILHRHSPASRRARGRAFASAPLYSFPEWRLQHMFRRYGRRHVKSIGGRA